jgi:hypothetical protein
MDSEQFYVASVSAISTAQNMILQQIVDGLFIGETVERTGVMYIQAHARLKALNDVKEEIKKLWTTMTGDQTEKQKKEAPDDSQNNDDAEPVY